MKSKTIFLIAVLLAGSSVMRAQTQTSSYDTDRGFVHPGGLHTQADFDRIKQQLADGNPTVTAAYNILKSAEFAQSTCNTYPVETIVRGGSGGQNYINAARGAAIAYQNGLRWKIEGTEANAKHAVDVLMAWARTTKLVTGDSNYALAAGLYGYEFAQAAELVRDYEGWSHDDFETFKQWMLEVWYPSCIGFLRGRNGTWENSGKWWQAPGHYWSNWGLCNALAVISIGVLCDDVYIYNQGMSYMKYDQVGTFTDPRTADPILNDGLTEFIGNLVVTTSESELETGAYGKLGQMNESGRDTGHAAMAAGLAVDIAHQAWNQGDDLFAYMDHRLAAGIEYIAAQTQSVEGLPWTNYKYGTNGIYYTDSRCWTMTGPALGAQMRPYWGTVIGIYEGVKGVRMPFSEKAYKEMGIDAGGMGSTSGGYDHLGYSVLMNTYNGIAPADKVPTELTGKIEYSGTIGSNLIPSLSVERTLGNVDGKVISHNELGGLVNTFTPNVNTGVPTGQTATLMPQLPEGEEDTGDWMWNTGETTRNLTVGTDHSFMYRVTYTNKNGVKSQQCFPIAVKGDCTPTRLTPSVTYNNETASTDTIDVLYGKTVTLSVSPACGWGSYKWSTEATTQSVTTSAIKEDQEISVAYTNQGGAETTQVFRIHVLMGIPYSVNNDVTTEGTEVVAEQGDTLTLGLTTPSTVLWPRVSWSDGTSGSKTLKLENVQESGAYTVSFPMSGSTYSFTFNLYVRDKDFATIEPGNYAIVHAASGRLLTANGSGELVSFDDGDIDHPADGQLWYIANRGNTRHCIVSLPDSLGMTTGAKLGKTTFYSFYFDTAVGSDHYDIHTGLTANNSKYWTVNDDGTVVNDNVALTQFPFLLVPVGNNTGINSISVLDHTGMAAYDLSGRRVLFTDELPHGIYIVNGKKIIK